MSYESIFKTAVQVIRNLPKHGAYQPSQELMLRFYAFYKQATEGPNRMPKPNFWDVVKKAKWDAWTKLGDMTREEAMRRYVEELQKIVETMSYNENVAEFMTSLESFYESVPPEDLQMLIGPFIERLSSQPGSPLSGSPLGSREASPQRLQLVHNETASNSSYSVCKLPIESDDDEDFLDSIEVEEMDKTHKKEDIPNVKFSETEKEMDKATKKKDPPILQFSEMDIFSSVIAVNGGTNISEEEEPSPRSEVNGGTNISEEEEPSPRTEEEELPAPRCICFDVVMRQTALQMRQNFDDLQSRVSSLEIKENKEEKKLKKNCSSWWPFTGLANETVAFIILWPLLLQLMFHFAQRRRF